MPESIPEPTALDAIATGFRALTSRPHPPTLDGTALGHGLPARPIELAELRALVLLPTTNYATRDVVWAELVRRARSDGEDWTIGLAGMLLPGLVRAFNRATGGCRIADPADLAAETVAGFLDALQHMDESAGRVPARLCWAAYRRARRARDVAADIARHEHSTDALAVVPEPCGHPDLLLAAAVAACVITRAEAEVIASTRIDEVSLKSLALPDGLLADTLRKRRRTAERRLARWLGGDEHAPLSDFGPAGGLSDCGSSPDGAASAGDQEMHRETTQKGGEAPCRPPTAPAARPAPTPTRSTRSRPRTEGQSPCPAPWPSVPPCWWPVPFPPPLRMRRAVRR